MDIISELNKPKNHQFNYQPIHDIKQFMDSEYEQREIQSKSLLARTFKDKNPIIGVAPVSMNAVHQYVDQQFKLRQLKQMTIRIQRYYVLKKRLKALEALMVLVIQSQRATTQHMLYCWWDLYQSELQKKVILQRVVLKALNQEAQLRIKIKKYIKKADQHYIRRYFHLYYNETIRRLTLAKRLKEYLRQRGARKMANIYNLMKVKYEYTYKKNELIKYIEQKDMEREKEREKHRKSLQADAKLLSMDRVQEIKEDPFEQDIQPIVFKELITTRTRLLVSAQVFMRIQEKRYLSFQKFRLKLDLVSLQGSALRQWQKTVRKIQKQRKVDQAMFQIVGKNLFYKWSEAARGRHAIMKYCLLKWIKGTRNARKEKQKELIAQRHFTHTMRKKVVYILKVYRTSMIMLRFFQQAVLKTPVSELVCRSLLLIYVGRTQVVTKEPLTLTHRYDPAEDVAELRAADVNPLTLTDNVAFILQYKFMQRLKAARFRRIAFYRLVTYAYGFETMARLKACIKRWKEFTKLVKHLDDSEKERKMLNNDLDLGPVSDEMNKELLDKQTIMEIKMYAQIGNSYSTLVACIETGTLYKQKMIYDVHGKTIKQLQSVIARAEQNKKGSILNVYVLYILQMILMEQQRNQICIFKKETEDEKQEGEGQKEQNQTTEQTQEEIEKQVQQNQQQQQIQSEQVTVQQQQIIQNQSNSSNQQEQQVVCIDTIQNDLEACAGRVDRVINVLRTVLSDLPLYDLVRLAGILDTNSGYGLSRRVQTIPGRPCTITFNTKQLVRQAKSPQLVSNFLIPYAHFYIQNATTTHLTTRNGQNYIQQLLNQLLESFFVKQGIQGNNTKDPNNQSNQQVKKQLDASDMSAEARDVLAVQIRRLDIAPTRAQLFKIESLVAQMLFRMGLDQSSSQKSQEEKKDKHHKLSHLAHKDHTNSQKDDKSHNNSQKDKQQEESTKMQIERQLKLVLPTYVRYATTDECDIDVWARKSQVPQIPRPPIQQLFLSDLDQLFIGRKAFLKLQEELQHTVQPVKPKIQQQSSQDNLLLNLKLDQNALGVRRPRNEKKETATKDSVLEIAKKQIEEAQQMKEAQEKAQQERDAALQEIKENNAIELEKAKTDKLNESQKTDNKKEKEKIEKLKENQNVQQVKKNSKKKENTHSTKKEKKEVLQVSSFKKEDQNEIETVNALISRPTQRIRAAQPTVKLINAEDRHEDDIDDLQRHIDGMIANIKHEDSFISVKNESSSNLRGSKSPVQLKQITNLSVDLDALSSQDNLRKKDLILSTSRNRKESFTDSKDVFGIGGLSVKNFGGNSEVMVPKLDFNIVDKQQAKNNEKLIQMTVLSEDEDQSRSNPYNKYAQESAWAPLSGRGHLLGPRNIPRGSMTHRELGSSWLAASQGAQMDLHINQASQKDKSEMLKKRATKKQSRRQAAGSRVTVTSRASVPSLGKATDPGDGSITTASASGTAGITQTKPERFGAGIDLTADRCTETVLSSEKHLGTSELLHTAELVEEVEELFEVEGEVAQKPSMLEKLLHQARPEAAQLIQDAQDAITAGDDGSQGYEKCASKAAALLGVLRAFFLDPEDFHNRLQAGSELHKAAMQIIQATTQPRPQRLHFNECFSKWFLGKVWDFGGKDGIEQQKKQKQYKPDQDFVDYKELLGDELQRLLGLQNFAQEAKQRLQIYIKVFPQVKQQDGPFQLKHIGLSLGVSEDKDVNFGQKQQIDGIKSLKGNHINKNNKLLDEDDEFNFNYVQKAKKVGKTPTSAAKQEKQQIQISDDKRALQRFHASARRKVIVEKLSRYEYELEAQKDRRETLQAINRAHIGITSPVFNVLDDNYDVYISRGAFGGRARSVQAAAARRASRISGYDKLKARYRPGTSFDTYSDHNMLTSQQGRFTRAHMIVHMPVPQVADENYMSVAQLGNVDDMTVSMLYAGKSIFSGQKMLSSTNKRFRPMGKILIRSYIAEEDLNNHISNTTGYTRIIPVSPIRQFNLFNNVVIADRQLRRQQYPRVYAVVGTRQESRAGRALPQILIKSYSKQ